MPIDDELVSLDATQLVAAYASGALSPVDVTDAVLARIEICEPQLNAFYVRLDDAARAAARESEQRWRAGAPAGPIDGVPVTIKENVPTVGTPTPLASAVHADAPPATVDGPPAARTFEAGGVVVGKTTMPELGFLSSGVSSLHGVTRSPWNLAWSVGGSSGGASAAAAARLGPLHVGSDIGGSVRLPAGWLGLAGLKPTHGLVPVDPPYMGRCVGPIARTVADLGLFMSVLSRPDARDHTSLPAQDVDWGLAAEPAEVRGLRVGLLLDAGCGMPTDPGVAELVGRAARTFADAGAAVEEIKPFMTPALLEAFDTFFAARTHRDLSTLAPERRAKVLPFIGAWAERAARLTGADVMSAHENLVAVSRESVAASAPYDVVLSPVAPGATFPAEWPMPSNDPERAMDHIGYTMPSNISGQPAATVNCGFLPDGRPVGLHVVGRRHGDLDVLRVARWYEATRPADAVPAWPEAPFTTAA